MKSALIFNFAKFTSWPVDVLSGASEFVACVVGNRAVGQALERVAKDRLLGGRRVVVVQREARDTQSLRTCHLVYVGAVEPKQLSRTLAELRGTPVLSIIDVEDSTSSAGIADVFVENGRVRFQLDNGLAKQGRLELSSQLLSLASRVRENAGVTR